MQLGIGFACYVSAVDVSPERAEVGIDAAGAIQVRCGTFSHGQSHATTFGRLVSREFGLPLDTVSFLDSDTAAIGRGGGTGGSRSAQMAGGAALTATRRVLDRARSLAAALLEADPGDLVVMAATQNRPAGIGVAGVPTSVIDWRRLATEADALGSPLVETVDYQSPATHPSGTHASVVAVDTETGRVTVVAHAAVDDCGTVLDAAVVEGQQHGGSAAGIGQALFEEFVYDPDGNPRSAAFTDYLLTSATELPSFLTDTMDIPSPVSVTGAKGIGENGAIAAPSSVQNAVVDALSPFGVRHVDLPVTPERVWRALHSSA